MTQIVYPKNFSASQMTLEYAMLNGYNFTYTASKDGVVILIWRK